MIVTVEEALDYVPKDASVKMLEKKIKAIESMVRSSTNNTFQDTRVRFYAASATGALQSSSPFLKAGDSVEIGETINSGVYTVKRVGETEICLDDTLLDCPDNMVTKVVYPPDVQEGVLNLLKWEYFGRDKVGIKTETVSRHSVTYFDMDSTNSRMGYPVSLTGFLKPYRKARR